MKANKFIDKVLIFIATQDNYTHDERAKIYAELRKESDELIKRDYNL